MISKSVFEVTKGKVLVPHGDLYYEKTGVGEPLILSHGGFVDRRDWRYQVNDFAKKFTTIIYDQRGCGDSYPIITSFSPADDVKAIMDHLNIKKTALIGHGVGGMIAIDFTLKYPEKVSALILIASGFNGYSWSKEYLDWIMGIWHTPEPEEMMKRALAESFYNVAMSNPKIKKEIETIMYDCFKNILNWKTFDIRSVQWFSSDHISKLKEIKIPTLVIYGEKDTKDVKQIAHILAENLPNTKLYEMQDADHLLNNEKPEELNTLVLDFLSKK